MEKRTKFSIGYYIMALVGLFALQSQFLMSPPPEISYSTFRSYLSEGKIQNIEIGREYLKGATLSDTGDESTASFRVRRIPGDRRHELAARICRRPVAAVHASGRRLDVPLHTDVFVPSDDIR